MQVDGVECMLGILHVYVRRPHTCWTFYDDADPFPKRPPSVPPLPLICGALLPLVFLWPVDCRCARRAMGWCVPRRVSSRSVCCPYGGGGGGGRGCFCFSLSAPPAVHEEPVPSVPHQAAPEPLPSLSSMLRRRGWREQIRGGRLLGSYLTAPALVHIVHRSTFVVEFLAPTAWYPRAPRVTWNRGAGYLLFVQCVVVFFAHQALPPFFLLLAGACPGCCVACLCLPRLPLSLEMFWLGRHSVASFIFVVEEACTL